MTPSPQDLIKIIESDASIRRALDELNKLIKPSSLSLDEALSKGFSGVVWNEAGIFVCTNEFDILAEKIRKRLTKTFGAFTDEIWFAACLRQYASEILINNKNASVKFFSSIIGKAIQNTIIAFPCRNVSLIDTDEINLGYSKIYSAKSLLKLLEKYFEKSGVSKAEITPYPHSLSIAFEGWGVSKFEPAKAYWVVNTSAPEDLWGEYLEIAVQRSLSLMRCYINPHDVLNHRLLSYYPHRGEVEVDPILGRTDWKKKIAIRDEVILKGGGKLPSIYPITVEFAEALKSEGFLELIENFQNMRPLTIATALSDSFFWQSRARQSHNRAERVLFFFTALEALVSRRDTSAPVSETVARFTACLMSKEHSERTAIAAEIKQMYTSRSQIVHQGMASTYASIGSRLQEIVETVTQRIIQEANLDAHLDSFINNLAKASFGEELGLREL